MIQFSRLASREENLPQLTRCRYFRETIELGSSKRHPESVSKSRWQLDRGQAMPGTSGPGIATYLSKKNVLLGLSRPADQLVEADVPRDVTTRSHRRIESSSYVRCG